MSRGHLGSRGHRHGLLCGLLTLAGVVTVRSGLAQTATGSWRTVASLPTARVRLAAVTGSDGRIYVLGGNNRRGTALSAVEVYGPRTNTWACSVGDASSGCSSTRIAPLPTARPALVAAPAADGRIYAIGGFNRFKRNSPLDTVEAYDPSTNRWTCSVGDMSSGCSSARIAPLPTPRYWLGGATGPDGRIYALGGCSPHECPTAIVEVYDPATNRWACSRGDLASGCSSRRVAPLPIARFGLAAVAGPHGRVYAMGGHAPDNFEADFAEAYNPRTNTWRAVAPLSTGRQYLAAATGSDGQIYVLGGLVTGHARKKVEAYAPSTDTWSTVAPMHTARWGLAATAGPDGRIYALGGAGDGSTPRVLHTADAYSPTAPLTATATMVPTSTSTLTATPTGTPATRTSRR